MEKLLKELEEVDVTNILAVNRLLSKIQSDLQLFKRKHQLSSIRQIHDILHRFLSINTIGIVQLNDRKLYQGIESLVIFCETLLEE